MSVLISKVELVYKVLNVAKRVIPKASVNLLVHERVHSLEDLLEEVGLLLMVLGHSHVWSRSRESASKLSK